MTVCTVIDACEFFPLYPRVPALCLPLTSPFFLHCLSIHLYRTTFIIPYHIYNYIIMTCSDPQDDVPFAEVLYGNPVFTKSLFHALTDQGVMVMQLGDSPKSKHVADELSKRSHHRASLIADLQNLVSFESMHTYEESHCQFIDAWTYLVSCKSALECRQAWLANAAQVDLRLQERILPSKASSGLLKYYDGATQQTYQRPHKMYETLFCRRPDHSNSNVDTKMGMGRAEECDHLRGYDPETPNYPQGSFEIRPVERTIVNGNGSNANANTASNQNINPNDDVHGVFALVDIPAHAMVMQESSSHSATFAPHTIRVMETLNRILQKAKQQHQGDDAISTTTAAPTALHALDRMIDMYGLESVLSGGIGYDIQCNALNIVNHGCHGTHNIIATTDDKYHDDDQYHGHSHGDYFSQTFNPVVERHLPHITGGHDVTRHDIYAGQEILSNYLTTAVTSDGWTSVVQDITTVCGESSGDVDGDVNVDK
jgi:hypothetical protein